MLRGVVIGLLALRLEGCAAQQPAGDVDVPPLVTAERSEPTDRTIRAPPPLTTQALPATPVRKPVASTEPSRTTEAPRQPTSSDAAIAKQIIAESRARYPGPCGCPYDTDRAGRRCGGRSAYSRPGGYSVICYPTDIPQEMIKRRRANAPS